MDGTDRRSPSVPGGLSPASSTIKPGEGGGWTDSKYHLCHSAAALLGGGGGRGAGREVGGENGMGRAQFWGSQLGKVGKWGEDGAGRLEGMPGGQQGWR